MCHSSICHYRCVTSQCVTIYIYLHILASFVYVVPKSDVLIVAAEKMASIYFLCPKTYPEIEVTFAYSLSIGSEAPEDLLAGIGFYFV